MWVVTGSGDDDALPLPGSLPVVVVWRGAQFGAAAPAAADAVVGDSDLDDLVALLARAPIAAAALVVLLRAQADRDPELGLAAESAVYSTLQAGPEFAAWLAQHARRPSAPESAVVRSERVGDRLEITLDRPYRHNAISAQLRDELCAALAVAVVDDSITKVTLRGNGPSFSSGGDLDEFGERPDPATAHITRLERSPARLIHRLSERVEVELKGTTLGGGIEMAAFAGTVLAHTGTRIGLPEIELGLIPGAGGTVSLPRRIGRQRTAALALTGRQIDAETALAWGLVDRLTE